MSRTPLTVPTAVTLACNLGKVVSKLGLTEEDSDYWNKHLGELHDKVQGVLLRGNWLDRLVQTENEAHRVFFSQTFDLTQFCSTLEHYGEERVSQWVKN